MMGLHQYLPDDFMCLSIIPLLKPRLRDPGDSDNCRLIAITAGVLQSYGAPVASASVPQILVYPSPADGEFGPIIAVICVLNDFIEDHNRLAAPRTSRQSTNLSTKTITVALGS